MKCDVNIEFEEPTSIKGYNSHGIWSTFGEIVDLESDRGNYPFIDFSDSEVKKYADFPAIWICLDPIDAFRYSIPASEWELDRKEIERLYPEWEKVVEEVDCKNTWIVKETNDGDGGILIVKKEAD